MRFKKLDLNLLVALDHMMALRSVSAAADRMFMSQSAMSNALTRLRAYFDDPLLVQVGKRMELTPRAEAMRPAIREILVRIDATIDSQPDFDPTRTTRTFNVLLSDYTQDILMPHVVAEFERQGARSHLNLLAQSESPHLMLERGDADLLVCPEFVASPDHPSALLFTDDYVVGAWADGSYGDVEMTVDLYESARHVIMSPPRQGGAPVEDAWLKEAGVTRNVDMTTFSFAALPYLLVGTGRIATLHGHIARRAMATVPLVIYPLPFPFPEFRQMLQWHGYRDSDPGILWLRSVFQSAAQKLMR